MATCLISLGANIGHRTQAIEQAISAITASNGVSAFQCSSFFETIPAGGPPDQPDGSVHQAGGGGEGERDPRRRRGGGQHREAPDGGDGEAEDPQGVRAQREPGGGEEEDRVLHGTERHAPQSTRRARGGHPGHARGGARHCGRGERLARVRGVAREPHLPGRAQARGEAGGGALSRGGRGEGQAGDAAGADHNARCRVETGRARVLARRAGVRPGSRPAPCTASPGAAGRTASVRSDREPDRATSNSSPHCGARAVDTG